ASFSVASLKPRPRLLRPLAAAEAARDGDDHEALAELALHLAGSVATLADGADAKTRPPSRSDVRRISDAVRRIELHADEPLALGDLAREAGISRYHFLRVFRHVVGATPHQYLLRTRLHRAAVRLRRTDESISRRA